MFKNTFTTVYLVAVGALEVASTRLDRIVRSGDERGQASAEYALVLLGAALLAIFAGKWLLEGGTLKAIFGDIIKKILGDMPK